MIRSHDPRRRTRQGRSARGRDGERRGDCRERTRRRGWIDPDDHGDRRVRGMREADRMRQPPRRPGAVDILQARGPRLVEHDLDLFRVHRQERPVALLERLLRAPAGGEVRERLGLPQAVGDLRRGEVGPVERVLPGVDRDRQVGRSARGRRRTTPTDSSDARSRNRCDRSRGRRRRRAVRARRDLGLELAVGPGRVDGLRLQPDPTPDHRIERRPGDRPLVEPGARTTARPGPRRPRRNRRPSCGGASAVSIRSTPRSRACRAAGSSRRPGPSGPGDGRSAARSW